MGHDGIDVISACRKDIVDNGFTVAAVTGDMTGCDWAYTVGLAPSFGHRELVVVGLPAPLAGALVETLAEHVADGRVFGPGHEVRMGPLALRAVEVDELYLARGDWFVLGREIVAELGRRWSPTLQFLWADRDGRFPDTEPDAGWALRQPVIAAGR